MLHGDQPSVSLKCFGLGCFKIIRTYGIQLNQSIAIFNRICAQTKIMMMTDEVYYVKILFDVILRSGK